MITDEKINSFIDTIISEITEIRHAIHRHPELSGEEFETSALIRKSLGETPLELAKPYLATDVVGMLYGKNQGDNITLRADIDALPMQEKTNLPYSSETPGKMHGCGHDGHTAILIGTAKVLSGLRDDFNGSIRFVFQPGEERNAMAKELLDAGAMDTPKSKAVFALHAHSGIPVGCVKTMSGLLMSGLTEFKIVLSGMSSIRSEPEKASDPLVGAACLITQMQGLIASKVSPLDSAIVLFKKIYAENPAGDAPAEAVIEGTIRYLDDKTGENLRGAVSNIIKGVETAFGLSAGVVFKRSYEPSRNSIDCVNLLKKTTVGTYGENMFRYMEKPSMGTEDFCYYLKRAPGAFFNLGTGENRPYCHNSGFDFNDESLRYGIMIMTKLALAALEPDFKPQK